MGDSTSNSSGGDGVKVAWARLGKVWWPGKYVKRDDWTDEIKLDIEDLMKRKKSVRLEQVHIVEFCNEDGFEVITNPNQIILDFDEEKKIDMIKRAMSRQTL
ncbi:hypothetical protein Ocin01_03452 [Orchesella cincta]|uniref:PWWP domain-containing protein n=1 Tax=Orchesella cincta TaxID=48709 RepID=A0A1D2NDP2_ORCCI|nr:hypothetical protein Ocin01_03452 [Orchesella cincta]